MRFSKFTLFILVLIILSSLYVTKISNLIAIKYDYEKDEDDILTRPHDTQSVLDDGMKQLMWFVQISDIHLSIFHDPSRISDFNSFCNKTIDAIQPYVVLASGDLTDAKNIDSMGSRQFVQEWKYYQDILKLNSIEDKTVWMDTRGNHDNFDVPSLTVDKSYFHHYSVKGKKHLRSYMEVVEIDEDKYAFIAVDACLDPGPRRPFNFIGLITPEENEELQKFEKESRYFNGTIWFGHYPTSCIISPEPGIRSLMRSGVAYFSGHLHTLGGTVPNMYTLHHSGTLELELGDWKDNRMFRVAAFDHGLFAFNDVVHGKWPVILVTNPKHALYNLPKKEPLEKLKTSTHIRILVFSPSKIQSVKIQLNSEDWVSCQHVDGPLYVAQWNPNSYSRGVHYIRVMASNIDGEVSDISQPFSLDNTKLSFRLLPRIALMLDAAIVFHNLFLLLVFVSIAPLLVLKFLNYLFKGKRGCMDRLRLKRGKLWGLVRKLMLLSSIDKLFIPILVYPLYISVGPWFVGEIIEGYYGVVFAWGTWVHGKILPGSFTYFYGFIQFFHLPLLLMVAHLIDVRFKALCWKGSPCSFTGVLYQHIPCLILLIIQAIFAHSFWLAYGTMAFMLGPMRTWSVLMGIYMWYQANTITANDFSSASSAWCSTSSLTSKTEEPREAATM